MTYLPAVIELRQYTLHPGQRDVLIELFEREFIEPQQMLGIHVAGIFRDLDAHDRFVWLRGFDQMSSRASQLAAFYDGPVWQRHRSAANATMIDSDDVLLLRPAQTQPPTDAAALVTATLCAVRSAADADALVALFERTLRPAWHAAGAQWVTALVTDATPNTFPRLPVREGERVVVWLSGFADTVTQQRHAAEIAASAAWAECSAQVAAAPQTLRLAPTRRSAIASPYVGQPHDFDFLVGRWNVRNRRLKQRHVDSQDWDEFDAIEVAGTHMNGIVSVDEITFPTHGFSGCTLRTLDLAARRWSIYWINSRFGQLCPPVHGGFCGDRGEFYGDDDDDDRKVHVRFIWERLGADRARWTQAFALPGGAWETNWVMEMTRNT